MMLLDAGPWEANSSCVEEDGLHEQYDTTCQRNPGHQNFFPVEKFSMDNLLPFYRKEETMKFIKTVSYLTVRVSAMYVSEERPGTVPGTDIPYPLYTNRGGNQVRTGSGWISDVVIFKDGKNNKTCNCKECRNSSRQTQEFAHIYVNTATHIVYDRQEGESAVCHLFLESGESPNVVTFTDMLDIGSDTVKDMCQLLYATHDLVLAERLKNMTTTMSSCLDSCNKSDYSCLTESGQQIDRQDIKTEPALHIVVSHPHGCAKQISIGYHGDAEDNQSPFPAITCPGSSGAPVIVLGWESFYSYRD